MYNVLIIYIAYLVHSAPVPHLCPARQWQRQWQTDNQSEEHCAGAQMLCQILFWKWVKTCFFYCIYHVCKHALSLSLNVQNYIWICRHNGKRQPSPKEKTYCSSVVPPAWSLSILAMRSFLCALVAGTIRFFWQLCTSVSYIYHLWHERKWAVSI